MTIQPGRELDALIAEKVMGLKVQKDQHTRGIFATPLPDDPEDFFIGETNYRVPKYSADISAAWQVVEKLKLQGLKVGLDLYPDGKNACLVFSVDNRGFTLIAEGYEDIASHAICLAALKAVGHK